MRWSEPKPIGWRPHAMTQRVLHWPKCSGCGLLLLKNEATRRALKQGHPIYGDEEA